MSSVDKSTLAHVYTTKTLFSACLQSLLLLTCCAIDSSVIHHYMHCILLVSFIIMSPAEGFHFSALVNNSLLPMHTTPTLKKFPNDQLPSISREGVVSLPMLSTCPNCLLSSTLNFTHMAGWAGPVLPRCVTMCIRACAPQYYRSPQTRSPLALHAACHRWIHAEESVSLSPHH